MNSRSKGCRGERDLRDQFREAGFLQARRGQQFAGGTNSPDVIVPEIEGILFECKRCEQGNLYNWLAQAERDASGKGILPNLMPVVCHRRSNCKWVAILALEDFLTLIKETDRIKS